MTGIPSAEIGPTPVPQVRRRLTGLVRSLERGRAVWSACRRVVAIAVMP